MELVVSVERRMAIYSASPLYGLMKNPYFDITPSAYDDKIIWRTPQGRIVPKAKRAKARKETELNLWDIDLSTLEDFNMLCDLYSFNDDPPTFNYSNADDLVTTLDHMVEHGNTLRNIARFKKDRRNARNSSSKAQRRSERDRRMEHIDIDEICVTCEQLEQLELENALSSLSDSARSKLIRSFSEHSKEKDGKSFLSALMEGVTGSQDVSYINMLLEIINVVATIEAIMDTDSAYGQMSIVIAFLSSKLSSNIAFFRELVGAINTDTGYDLVKRKFVGRNKTNICNEMEEQSMVDGLRSMIRSVSLKHAGTLLCALATVGLVQPGRLNLANFTLFNVSALSEKDDGLDFVDRVLGAIDFYMTRGWQCFTDMSLDPLLYGDDDLTQLVNYVSEARSGIVPFRQGNYLSVIGRDPSYYDDLMTKTEAKLRVAEKVYTKGPEARILQEQKSKFLKVREDYVCFKRSMTCRVAPMVVKIYGGSGVGKTSINSYTIDTVLGYNDFLRDPEHIIPLPTNDKFDSTARTNATCYVLDDLANSKAEVAITDPAAMIIRLKNNVPTTANMAEAQDKGKIFFEPKLVTITTNNEDLSAGYWSVSPRSILRRVDVHLEVHVDKKYAKNGMLYVEASDEVGDYWEIDVKEPSYTKERFDRFSFKANPIPNDHPLHLDIPFGEPMKRIRIKDYFNYISWYSKEYFIKQDKVVKHLTTKVIHMCNRCNLPGISCRCASLPTEPIVSNMNNAHEQSIEASVASWAANTAYNHIKGWCDITYNTVLNTIIPTWSERKAISSWSTSSLLNYKMNANNSIFSSANLLEWMPDWVVGASFFKPMYLWLRRKQVERFAKYSALCTAGVVAYIYSGHKRLLPLEWNPGYLLLIPNAWLVSYTYYDTLIKYELQQRVDLNDCAEAYAHKIKKAKQEIHKQLSLSAVTRAAFVAGGAGIAIAAIRMARSLYRSSRDRDSEQSLLQPESKVDVERRMRVPHMWENDDTPSKLGSTMTADNLANVVLKNTMYMKYEDGERSGACNCVFLKTGWVVMPYHVWFKKKGDKIDIGSQDYSTLMRFFFTRSEVIVKNVVQGGATFCETIFFKEVKRIGTLDLCLVNVECGGIFKDITKHLPTREEIKNTKGPCLYVRRDDKGIATKCAASFVSSMIEYDRPSGKISYLGGLSDSNHVFVKGDCCGTYISSTTNPKMIGFHLMGTDNSASSWFVRTTSMGGYGTLLREQLEEIMESYCEAYRVNSTEHSRELYDTVCGKKIELDTTANTALTSHVDPIRFEVLGICGKPNTYRTEYKPSRAYSTVVELFGPNMYQPTPYTKNNWQPFDVYLNNINNGMGHIENSILACARKDYLSDLYWRLNQDFVQDIVKPLDEVEILNGRKNVKYINAMNMSTAIGFPYTGNKRKYINESMDDSNEVVREFKDSVFFESFENNKRRYLRGQSCMLIMTSCQKDEIVKRYKDGGPNTKVRVFTAAGIDAQMLIRAYFLPVAAFLSTFPLSSECAVGVNCFSTEYSELRDHWVKHGEDRILAGDYSSWDQKLTPQLMMAAFGVMISIAECSGNYTSDDLKIMWGIARDMSYPLVIINGVLVRLHGSNPSGQNVTSHVNSIINSLLLRCAFFVKYGGTIATGSFRKYVTNMTYGDDMKAGISKYVDFTFDEYKTFLAHLNMKFTPPDKRATEGIRYFKESEASFLKRTSVYMPELNTYIGQLEIESIYKSLYYVKKSKVSYDEVITSTYQSALNEFFYHGKGVYEENLDKIRKLSECQKIYFPELKFSFEDRVEIWHNKYTRMIMPKDEIEFDLDEQSGNVVWLPIYNGILGFQHDTIKQYNVPAITGCNSFDIDELCNNYNITNNEIKEDNQVPDGQVSSLMLVEHSKTTSRWILANMMEQSEQLSVSNGLEGNVVTQFTTVESDMQVESISNKDSTFSIMHTPDVSLSDFLARPILLYTNTVDVNTFVAEDFRASIDFFKQVRIANRISNYAYISGKMHLKIVVNGSPFHYGKLIMAYEPMPIYATTTDPILEQVLQLPYVGVDITASQGAILAYDLIHPFGAIDLTDLDNPLNIVDKIIIRSLGPLRALGDTTDSVNYNVYAWMTNVSLSLPTIRNISNLTEQSEYAITNAQQAPSANVGSIMGNMVVRIKPYAKAAYNAIGVGLQIASAFGFSRPSNPPEIKHIMNKPYGNMSQFNVTDTSTKLALDSKNEVTVDPSVCGFGSLDEMTIVSLGKREMLLASFDWNSNRARRDMLQHWAVTPCYAAPSGTSYVCAPAFYAAVPFRYWRGTVKYRIEVIASPFHRGMLRIVYDPIDDLLEANVAGTKDDNAIYSHIMDITQNKNYEFCVGMGNNKNYLRTLAIEDAQQVAAGNVDLSGARSRFNFSGYVGVQVALPLTSTASSGGGVGNVTVNVYMSMSDDFEVADVVGDAMQGWTPLAVEQSEDKVVMEASGGLVDYMSPTSACLNMVDEFVDDGRLASIHFGEKITSIRQVLKRFTHYGVSAQSKTSGDQALNFITTMPSFPPYFGRSAVANYVFGRNNSNVRTSFLNWYAPAFLGWRGSIRWKIATIFDNPDVVSVRSDTVYRDNVFWGGFSYLQRDADGFTDVTDISTKMTEYHGKTSPGCSLNQTNLNVVHEIEHPYHYQERFMVHTVYPEKQTVVKEIGVPNTFSTSVVLGTEDLYVHRQSFYVATGDDFSLVYFKYTPLVNIGTLSYI